MLINGLTETQLGIVTDEPDIERVSYESAYVWNTNSPTPFFEAPEEKIRKFKCLFAVIAEGRPNQDFKLSEFLEKIRVCKVEYEGLIYDLYMSGNSDEPIFYDKAVATQVEFYIRDCYTSEKSLTLNQSAYLTINSPKSTDAILEITPTVSVVKFNIGIGNQNIEINNLEGGKTLIISKEQGILCDGNPKIDDVKLWSFPVLNPGKNNITIDKSEISVKIRYKERW